VQATIVDDSRYFRQAVLGRLRQAPYAGDTGAMAALGSGGATPVKMQVYDADGQEVSIDDADPPVRTAVRTLLAEVHGDQDAARAQIDIALSTAAPSEVAAVVMQALRWTIRLATECTKRDLPVAAWIAESLEVDEGD